MNEAPAFMLGSSSDTDIHRQRVLDSAKRLMAARGYECITVEAIARDADTTGDALLSIFRSKEVLLEAVFNEGWGSLNTRLSDIVVAAVNMREAALAILTALLHALGKDRDLGKLLLFESRRHHGDDGGIRLSRGFLEFESLLIYVFQRGQKDGSFSTEFQPHAATSALLGAAEGMMRDRLLAETLGQHTSFSEMQLRSTFEALIRRLAP